MLLGYNSFHSTMTVSVVSMAGIAQSKAHSWDCTASTCTRHTNNNFTGSLLHNLYGHFMSTCGAN